MKKLLGIVVLGLLLSSNAYAKNIYKFSNCGYHSHSKTDLSNIIVDLDNKKIKATTAYNSTTYEFNIVKEEGVYVIAKGDKDPDYINVKPERGNVFYRINLKYGSYSSYNKLHGTQTYNCSSLHFNNVLVAQNGENKKEESEKLKAVTKLPDKNIEIKKNFVAVNFCKDGAGYAAISDECPTSYTGTKSITTTYEVFLTKVKKPICYSKKEDRVQVRASCQKSREQYEVKYDGKNFYWNSNEMQITKNKLNKIITAEVTENNSLDGKYRLLVKKFGSKCESNWSNFFIGHKIGTPEFDKCLTEQKNESIKIAKIKADKLKAEKEVFLALNPEEKRAYTCANTFGFRKGTDKFKDCVFKIYATELELAKLEVEKQLAESLLATAKANAEAAQLRAKAAKAEGLLQKAQIEVAQAQAAATKQQAAASQAQAAATRQQSSISLMLQGLQMLQPQQPTMSTMTSCRWSGTFFNCW